MSIIASSDLLSEEMETYIIDNVLVKKIEGNAFSQPYLKKKETFVRPYKIFDSEIALPFRWALDNITGVKRQPRSSLTAISTKFTSTLRSVQQEIKEECINFLNQKGCVLISLYPGAGKTALSIYLASKIGLKTLIVCHRLVLIEQWKQAIARFIDNPRVGFVKTDKNKERFRRTLDNDFILVNAQNVKAFGREMFKDVGLVIIDEIHAILAESLSECLYHLSPRYLIGLSATPERPDGLDGLLDFYFGKETRIVRELYHPHIVYRIDTSIEYEEDSKTQWSAMITSQCRNEARNNLIVAIIRHFQDRHFLVLCKRVDQARYISERLEEAEEKVSLMVEDTNTYDPTSRIIVSNVQKVGVGFSHDVLDALVVAADMEEYFVQYLARVMRREDVKPIVFDLVDPHRSLKKHFSERKRVYVKAGGVIRDFHKEFPQFPKI